ncbi:hypothetical protein ACFSBG_06775 [Georgenia yuyongxinii]|uniref:hypothetical protein n=1 Tax=Georgenia yuyongxinii TaxID=2589797 RepID=UPI001CB700B5|nr:hypothetical protein [Georgenia yuyongxinii]
MPVQAGARLVVDGDQQRAAVGVPPTVGHLTGQRPAAGLAELHVVHQPGAQVPDGKLRTSAALVREEQAQIAVARGELDRGQPPAGPVVQVRHHRAGVRGDHAQRHVPVVPALGVLDRHEVAVVGQCRRLGVGLVPVQQHQPFRAGLADPDHDLVDGGALLGAAADDGGAVPGEQEPGGIGVGQGDGVLHAMPRR